MTRQLVLGSALLLSLFSLQALADDNFFPSEIRINPDAPRKVVAKAGPDLKSQEEACVQSMINQSPVTEATDIKGIVRRTQDSTVLSVAATLKDVPMVDGGKKDLQVTYHCEYLMDGTFTVGAWTRNLGGEWVMFQSATLGPDDLGKPFPAGHP